jgi:hypothetical protein
MSTKNTPSTGSQRHRSVSTAARHPQRGRRYSIEELVALADEGNAWAMSKVDEWEQRFANDFAGDLSDTCPDEDCEHFGESVNVLYSEHGTVLEVDHGNWSHYPAMAKAS